MIQQKKLNNDYGENYPNSKKIFINGSRPDIRVPMREIKLTETKKSDQSIQHNPSVIVYDTSGPATDPNFEINLEKGLPKLRKGWIEERNDIEEYEARGFQSGDDGLRQDDNRKPFSNKKCYKSKSRKKCNSNALC